MSLDAWVRAQIILDVSLKRSEKDSRIKYGPEERAYRARIQAYKDENPDVMLDIPSEISEEPISEMTGG